MPFSTDQAIKEKAEPYFGAYKTTFLSENGQVRADLFEQGGTLKAYIAFESGYDLDNVTDLWISRIEDWADDNGYAGRLQIAYGE